MRAIKFRAWDSKMGRFLEYSKQYPLKISDRPLVKDFVMVEQFTGLKDKNGKEIYEGDIIQHTCQHSRHFMKKFNNAVDYYAGGNLCGFRIKNKSFTRLLTANWLAGGDGEVIGNIHQHKHLL